MAIRPKKYLGQHFLVDEQIIADIITSVQPQATQHLAEIGPGCGALTKPLAASGCKLSLIEKDPDLIPALSAFTAAHPTVSVHHSDVLVFNWGQLTPSPVRLVGNLPYNISTPIIFNLLDNLNLFEDIHVMLQKEVAERLLAAPRCKAYGRPSVMLQSSCSVMPLLDVPASAFNPPPKVQSQVIRILPKPASERPSPAELQQLQRLTTAAFNQRRKTLANSLRAVISATQLEALGILPSLRAEALSVADFRRLATWLSRDEPRLD